MPSDVRDALRRGAPRPDGGPDIEAILRGGRRIRVRRRITIAAASAAVVAVAAVVAPNLDSLLATEDRIPPAETGPLVAKTNGRIAFVRSVPISGEPAADYNTKLNLVAPGGGTPEPVLEGVHYRGTPAWSPDGSRLAAQVPLELRILDVTTGDVRRLPWCEECGQPTWSPDGSRLIFSGRREGQDGLWTVREDGSDLRLLRAGDFEMAMPRWSPDGRLVAILDSGDELEEPRDRILLLDVEGGADPAPIEPDVPGYREGFGYIEGFSWAPDGRSVVLDAHMDGGGGGIYVADIETRALRLIVSCVRFSGTCVDHYPTFSPDGEQIAFTRASAVAGVFERGSDGFIGDVMVVDATGGTPRLLTGRPGLDCCPAWQPLPSDAE